MSKVRIVQLLCPARHCIIGAAYLSPDGAENPEHKQSLRTQFDLLVKWAGFDPWCGLCKSRDFHLEDAPTGFATMEEAEPHIREEARRQAETRKFWKASKG
jgi:hypothetical protein